MRIQEKEDSILASQTKSYQAEERILEMLTSMNTVVDGLQERIDTLERAEAECKERDKHILNILEQISRRQGVSRRAHEEKF
jgi:ferritin-like metal-binding protein YciE